MTKNMVKTFTIQDILFNKISRSLFKTRGTLEFFVIDELGNERKVIAMATLNFQNKIKQVRALYQREIPLVAALKHADVNQTITIDFSEFNKTFVRKPAPSCKSTHQPCFDPGFNTVIPDMSRLPLLMSLALFGAFIVFLVAIYIL